jgi:hypothetical protein
METTQKSSQSKKTQRFFADPKAYLSKDGEYLSLVLPGNLIVRKHVNFFKSVMGIPFTPKAKASK